MKSFNDRFASRANEILEEFSFYYNVLRYNFNYTKDGGVTFSSDEVSAKVVCCSMNIIDSLNIPEDLRDRMIGLMETKPLSLLEEALDRNYGEHYFKVVLSPSNSANKTSNWITYEKSEDLVPGDADMYIIKDYLSSIKDILCDYLEYLGRYMGKY